MNNYNLLCDDFYLDMYVNTKLDLPSQRDTILSFFERLQKQFPTLCNFSRRDNNYCLEEDSSTGQYKWIMLETDRIDSGAVNPDDFKDIYKQDRLLLELIPYMLGVSFLDIYSMDLTFGMDFDYRGNHDEIIAEAIFSNSAFACLLDLYSAKPIDISPSVVIALSEDCRTQARISIESRTSIFEPNEKEQQSDKAISLLFTIRQYPQTNKKFDTLESFENQCSIAEELMSDKVIPYIVKPLINVIAQKKLI